MATGRSKIDFASALITKAEMIRDAQLTPAKYFEWYWECNTRHATNLIDANTVEQMFSVVQAAIDEVDSFTHPHRFARKLHYTYRTALQSYLVTLQRSGLDCDELVAALRKNVDAYRSEYNDAKGSFSPELYGVLDDAEAIWDRQ